MNAFITYIYKTTSEETVSLNRTTPPLWQVYNGQGNTAYSTRKALLDCFHKWIERKDNQQVWWVADREYIGKDWFKELLLRKMQFCIRLRK